MGTTGKMAAFYVQKHGSAGKAIYLHAGDDIYSVQLHRLIYHQRSVTRHQLYIFLKIQHFISCFVIWSHHVSNSKKGFKVVLIIAGGLTAGMTWDRGETLISEHKKEQNRMNQVSGSRVWEQEDHK